MKHGGTTHRIPLKHKVTLTIEHKKYILPFIMGGLVGAFCIVMIWNNLYSPWPVLITLLISMAALYFGWVGTWMLVVHQQGTHLYLPLSSYNTYLQEYCKFFNQYEPGKSKMMIYHITSQAQWQAQLSSPHFHDDSLKNEGYIHASGAEQVAGTLLRFYEGRNDLLILCIDALSLDSPVKYESATDGEGIFPHIYGPINKGAIAKTILLNEANDFQIQLLE